MSEHHDHHGGCHGEHCGHHGHHGHHDRQENCGCGHDHHHEEKEGPVLLLGAVLFAAGMITGLLALTAVSVLCQAAAYVLLGLPVLRSAVRNLLKGHVFDENFLMSIATVAAFAIGETAEAVGIMLFYRVGEFFEHKAADRSRSRILEAVDLRPEVVTLEDGRVIPAEEAKAGDVLVLRPGDRVPLDGRVVFGVSRLDTAAVTGESVPVAVEPGSRIVSGCVNISGPLTMEVEKPLAESMVTRILESVEHAAASKPRMDRFITRFSRVYTPIVVGAAVAVAVVPSLFTGDWSYWVYTAISFLVMSCPCALVLSVPLAFFSGIGVAGKQGILFKGGAAMEALAQVRVAALDKTGTLTRGDFKVQQVVGGERVLILCAACESASTHLIAQSICRAAQGMALPRAETVEELAGMGIRAQIDGRQVLCGNHRLLARFGIQAAEAEGTVVYLAEDGRLLGHLVIGDTVKEEAAGAVAQLKKQGIIPVMLTGDREGPAQAAAKAVGLEQVYAGLLPQQKLQIMETLRQQGRVLFVGDGINDAPVLAGADVGGAMGSGADAAMEAADVVFLTSRADAIPQAMALARRTNAIAWQNVALALGIKVTVMVLGLLGFANLWLTVFADTGAALLCVGNGVRMLYGKQ